jgi:predicted permease
LRIRGLVGDVSAVVSGKLLLHPLLVAIFLTLFGPVEPMLAIGAVVMASSPMLSIYSIFGQKQEMQGFCAASQLLATVASFVSIGTIIWLLHATELFGKWQPL